MPFPVFTALLFFAVQVPQIPVGTVIPIMLNSGLNAQKSKAEQQITGRVMQDVPLADGEKLSEGSTIRGHVVKVEKQGASGSLMEVRFDEIEDHGTTIPITVSLVALASMFEVSTAQSPVNSTSNMDSSSLWVTRQVGGEVVNRGRGKVGTPKGAIVGKWLQGSAVMVKLTPNPEAGCKDGPGYDREQPTWIFSSNACGIYGLSSMKIEKPGNAHPAGEVVLKSEKNIDIRRGSGWLLMAVSGPGAASENH